MTSLRQTFDVSWDGGEVVRVTTNARDMGVAQELLENPGLMAFALIHNALKRTGHSVPDFDTFLDQLDSMESVSSDTPADPTRVVDSLNGQLPSLSPQVPTSISG